MRRGLIRGGAWAALVGLVLVAAPAASADPGSGGANSGAGAGSTREGAEAAAWSNNLGNRGGGGNGGGGHSTLECTWHYRQGGRWVEIPYGELEERYDDSGLETIPVRVECVNTATGEETVQTIDWSPAVGEEIVDPEELALSAQASLRYSTMVGDTSPPLDAGSYAQLRTYLSVDDWDQTLEASATAGSVTSTVTARPVRQYWAIYDDLRGGDPYRVTCEPSGSGQDEGCYWDPVHSSAGQPVHEFSGTGEPCFRLTVTVEWEVTWEASGAPGGGTLDPGWSASSACLVVAEVQAVVDDG